MSEKIKLNILGLSYSQTQSGAYALVLAEEEGNRRIPIIIGAVEAQAIAIQLEGLKPPRPLTHDLFLNTCTSFDIKVVEVFIHRLEEGIFYADLICVQGDKQVTIDSRTSDAVALALRFNCDIFTTSDILEKAGIILEFNEEEEEEKELKMDTSSTSQVEKTGGRKALADMSPEELKSALQKAIGKEEYEEASKIQEELNRRIQE